MNVCSMMLRLCAACMLAGIVAAPLAAQTANNSSLTNTSTTGIQPVNDVVPLIVWFTGPANWDYVGSAAGMGNGTNGGGNGQWLAVPHAAAQPPAATPFALQAQAANKPVWPNFAPIASVQPAPDPPAFPFLLPPPIWKK